MAPRLGQTIRFRSVPRRSKAAQFKRGNGARRGGQLCDEFEDGSAPALTMQGLRDAPTWVRAPVVTMTLMVVGVGLPLSAG